MNCRTCKYCGKQDTSGAFGDFVVPCVLDPRFLNMVDCRDGCKNYHNVESNEIVKDLDSKELF